MTISLRKPSDILQNSDDNRFDMAARAISRVMQITEEDIKDLS